MQKKIKLLLIEDNTSDVVLIEVFLKEAFPGNYILVKADHLAKGIEFLGTGDFDVIICDLALPDSYGIETFGKVFKAAPGIPIIVFTGHGDVDFGIRAVSMGAADFLNKGELDGNVLKRAVTYSIERNNLKQQVIAQTKNLEENEKKYRSLFEDSKDAIYITTHDGKFLDFNRAAEELFGYTGEEMRKLNPGKVYRNPDDRKKLEDILQQEGSIKDFEAEMQKKDGTPLICLITAVTRNAEDGIVTYQKIVHDVTEQRQIEELRQAKEVAEKTANARHEFLSVMSHEIRTPLNAVIGITQLLVSENPSKSQLEHLNLLRFAAQNLLGLINNVLDFSKIESGKMQFEIISFNFNSLARTVVDSFMHQAKEKDISLKLFLDPGIPELVIGDSVRLTQILGNLISNAIKFTDAGKVTVKIEEVSSDNNELELLFEVKDTGIGIGKNKQDEIFESFKQAEASIFGRYGGTGLGLAISKRLVELMGGKIVVESELGHGATFRFNMSFIKSYQTESELHRISVSQPDKNALKGIRILLAEDNRANQFVIKKFLSRWGARVDTAANGRIAVDKITSKKYDLVLMDLQMPDMDGYEANSIIRSLGYSISELPIIAITAYAMHEDKVRVFNSGMNDYISKPINAEELYQKILKNIYNKHASRNEFKLQHVEQNKALNLKALIDSFRNEPDFIRRYLAEYEKDFSRLRARTDQLSRKKDTESLAMLIHKTLPSIKRLEKPKLEDQLNELQGMLSEKEEPEENIFKLTNDIQKSCDDVLAQIKTLKEEYL